jgi:osmoprotectant transport system permease protein
VNRAVSLPIACCVALLFPAMAVGSAPAAVRVGCKIDVEEAILAQMAVELMGADGTAAVATPPLGGTDVCFAALLHGDIDAYPDYTGTIAVQILHDPSLKTDGALRAALAAKGIGMTGSLGFDDTYAIGMSDARAAALGIRTIGDLAGHPDLRLGFSIEFASRPDGWPGVRSAYGLADLPVQRLDHELAYRALVNGQIDATDLYSTDAEIAQHHLRVLADDRHFFPAYRAVYLYRLGAPAAAVAALDRLQGTVDAGQMQAMNAEVKVDHRQAADVAAGFLRRAFHLATVDTHSSTASELWHLTRDHLLLVGISLAAAIAVGLPLGVASAEFPRFGQGVLVTVAGIYTVPALALLVLLISIPHVPLGKPPAIVALFLYSLLPIVRNTQAGLRSVPPQLRESAEVLGLGRWARLVRVEVPMASASILAGVKTSAVLNVGTATLGGFIAAGGYGEAIFQGIIFHDNREVLLGAVPAALMALAFQGGFDLIEPLLVPRGLRLRRQASE